MAVLSKIRQKSFLVIAIVGLALFAFIIGALIENGGFGQTSRNANNANPTIAITRKDFCLIFDKTAIF